MTEYSKKMKRASKILFEDRLYDFEPKSIWDYKKYTEFDKKITDKISSELELKSFRGMVYDIYC